MTPIRVMFVCLGNICRSPLAQGIFEDLVRQARLAHHFEVASSGVGAWHIGEKPDVRMSNQRAQQLEYEDLEYFDHIYAMDRSIERDVLLMDRAGGYNGKVNRFSEYDPDPNTDEVPDPYFDGSFELVFTIIDRTCRKILEMLTRRYNLAPKV